MKNDLRVTHLSRFQKRADVECPLVWSKVSAGFPSPADDYLEKNLDLNEFLVKHPAATFFVRVAGESMEGAGIFHDDILIVDRALEPKDNKVVIAIVEGEMLVKRLIVKEGRVLLKAENHNYPTIEIFPSCQFEIWGVVTCVLHQI